MTYIQVAGLYFSFDQELDILAESINYKPFITSKYDREEDYLFHLTVDTNLKHTETNDTYIYWNEMGSYGVKVKNNIFQWILKKANSEEYYLMNLDLSCKTATLNFEITDEFTLQAVDDYIRFAFIYTSAFHQTVILHASCIKNKDKGIAFMGRSGIGKSTHSSLWIKFIDKSELLNDDQPAVRILHNIPIIFGTPWSGKTLCYKNLHVKLEAILCMNQQPYNKITPLPNVSLFTHLLSACSLIRSEKSTLQYILKTLAIIAEKVKGGILENKPEEAAAQLAYTFLVKSSNLPISNIQ